MEGRRRKMTEEGEGEGDDGAGIGGFARLPEECVARVLAFTTPRDTCRAGLVSAAFLSAAASDAVWANFLPPDCAQILSRAVRPLEYSSKKELYFRLCDPILVDDGGMSFHMERSTGKKCYMISQRTMSIIWSDHPQYWRRIHHPESRFAEVAELLSVCWLHIGGTIDSQLLSHRTTYAAYLVFKLAPDSYGLNSTSQFASVKLGAYALENSVSLQPDNNEDDSDDDDNGGGDDDNDSELEDDDESKDADEDDEEARRKKVKMCLREDGWLEVELGEFYNDEGDEGEVEIKLYETTELHWKRGLIIQGLDIRPKL
ncbi:F-box protein PP2-B10 [Ananas comosus]|uniref:F-box protein PP2-B10 n=1 Tax=Ananas comosus TaxID=4615 RepID=A0A199WA30_ANACO|nr:F-box protein PP2-B10 [Ananas comosus]